MVNNFWFRRGARGLAHDGALAQLIGRHWHGPIAPTEGVGFAVAAHIFLCLAAGARSDERRYDLLVISISCRNERCPTSLGGETPVNPHIGNTDTIRYEPIRFRYDLECKNATSKQLFEASIGPSDGVDRTEG